MLVAILAQARLNQDVLVHVEPPSGENLYISDAGAAGEFAVDHPIVHRAALEPQRLFAGVATQNWLLQNTFCLFLASCEHAGKFITAFWCEALLEALSLDMSSDGSGRKGDKKKSSRRSLRDRDPLDDGTHDPLRSDCAAPEDPVGTPVGGKKSRGNRGGSNRDRKKHEASRSSGKMKKHRDEAIDARNDTSHSSSPTQLPAEDLAVEPPWMQQLVRKINEGHTKSLEDTKAASLEQMRESSGAHEISLAENEKDIKQLGNKLADPLDRYDADKADELAWRKKIEQRLLVAESSTAPVVARTGNWKRKTDASITKTPLHGKTSVPLASAKACFEDIIKDEAGLSEAYKFTGPAAGALFEIQ